MNKTQKAFSLIEILLVVVIMVSLSAMVVPRLTGRAERVKEGIARTDIKVNIPTALKLYELDNGTFPTTQQGLDSLVEKSILAPIPSNWNGPYIEGDTFLDPWGNKYIYKYPSAHGEDYDLYSLGKTGEDDDSNIVNWE
ncbi:MAG: type II secretion system major pseudopilin GspG [Candidatus Omnitrophica bacterium]|nr:type II secretion system major pseudopilin GspG [Candidatus Omnitrophota bacterium]MDD5081228.1 type II secretion system major pseudopilin GspG [Candidatus Omnitrophota bacterium]MDD5441272.1 type II secretion system major pseudopilin GspG [Candidatus Omnitrophota bacterium]